MTRWISVDLKKSEIEAILELVAPIVTNTYAVDGLYFNIERALDGALLQDEKQRQA